MAQAVFTAATGARVPEHLPLVVRNSPLRLLSWAGGMLVVSCGLSCLLAYLAALLTAVGAGEVAAGLAIVVGVPLLLAIPLLLVKVYLMLGRGPILAASADGVSYRTGAGPFLWSRTFAVWLPWHQVAAVSVTRKLLEPAVYVIPRVPVPGQPNPRRAMTMVFADHRPEQIYAELHRLAAGRAPVYPYRVSAPSGWPVP